MSTSKVRVAVRVRPFSRREIELGTRCCIEMEGQQTILHPTNCKAADRKSPKTFAFDHCFWSFDERKKNFAGQETVFKHIGTDILENAFEGYNACIFAYGQTGSGKSFSMMGTHDNRGIIPRLCDSLFERIAEETNDESLAFNVEVSYMEIYNEKVRDLLDPKGGKTNLKVREHKIYGPYVDGLSTLAVSSFEDIESLMLEGNKSRTVAATNMNAESSRSHAVFNVTLTQTLTDIESDVSGEKVSKLSLVDLAGSERANKSGATGERLKEGSNINKSLTTLGLVISALSERSAHKMKPKFVPYRDSVLTWLLKDNLGGNSKTVMVATVSPAADNYDETLSTLRYADRAKKIVNHAVINEDPNARIIRELRDEVDTLKKQLKEAESMKAETLKERLHESEKLMREMTETWEDKLQKTERIIHENQQHLEKMGISVQTSGIKVEKDKCFLVNLNADPSLNELLVYYLKEHTLVGRPSAPSNPDIQLSGLGILSEHCIIDIENDYEVFVTPKEGARTCVNGSQISSRTSLKHGDRVLWGNNHFFRINCPRPPGVGSSGGNTPESEVPVDYDFAQSEVMMKELGNDPIQNAMKTLETHHKEDKDKALERQKDMYERQLEMLRNKLTPTQKQQLERFDIAQLSPQSTDSNAINMQTKYIQWEEERDEIFRQSLSKLREEVVKANALVREANFLAEEMGKKTEFHVTLQIPASNLTPNRKRGAIVSEPAIQVRRKSKGTQVWSMEKMINKIIDMRDMYEERKERGLPLKDTGVPISGDPFYESQENHNLIGVANIFLEVLFHDVRIEYAVPIINQQGEVSGRLHVELQRISGPSLDWTPDSDCSTDSGGFEVLGEVEPEGLSIGSQLTCRLKISHASGLPPSLANFVFCQYTFWGEEDYCVVPPVVKQVTTRRKIPEYSMKFDHVREYTVNVTEEFIEHALEGSLAVEVWGHRSAGFDAKPSGWEVDSLHAKSRSLADRWGELTRKIELWLEVLELNEQGEYFPVELQPRPEVLTGGVFQLRQGHSRRVCVKVKPVQDSGTLPLVCEAITGISVGSICGRSKLQKGLDSYQDEDLTRLREKWSEALMRRREYLDEQIHKIINKSEKNDTDVEREASLINQWVSLTEERNAVLVPAANSGIPGAPAEWNPPLGMETHIPVLFLDLNADEMGSTCLLDGAQPAGTNSILPKEHGTKFYNLPIVKYCDKDVSAVASWDSSIHDSLNLNRVTGTNERVYLIVKVVARLSHPAAMEMVLRKRICVNIYKKQSFSFTFRKKFYRMPESCHSCGVTYEVVSNIPKASEDPEDRESLALMAASGADEGGTADGETYIEKYTKGVSAVESILALDRLRQEVVIKEKLAAQGRPLRKTASVPNIQGALSRSMDARFDIIDEDFRMPRSESLYSYLNSSQQSATLPSYTLHNPQPNPELFSFFRGRSKSEAYDGQLMYGSAGSLIHPGSPGMAMYTSSPKSISPSPSKYSHHYLGPVKEEKSKESMVENSNLNLYDDDDSCSLSPKAIAIPRTSPSHSRESPSRSLDSPIQSLELEKESSLQKTFTMSLENDNISNSSCQSNVQSIVMSSNTDVDSFGNQDTETHRPLSMVSSGYSSNLTLTEDTLSIHSYDEGPDHKVNSNKSTEEEIKSPFSDEEDGNTSTLTEERLQKVLNEDANEKINDDDKKDVSVETSLKTNSEGHSACKKVQVSDLLHRAEKYNSENLDMKEDEPIEITTSVAMVMNKNNVTECIEKKMSDISNDVDKLGEKKNALVTMAMDTYAEEHCDVVLATSDSTSVSIETNSVSLEISELKADDDNFADISGLEPLLIIEDENENNSTSHLLEKEKSITTKINDLQEIKVEQQSLEIIESFKLDQTVVTPTNEFELHISEDEKLILTENDAESRLSSVSGMHALEDDMSDDSLSMCSFDSRQDGDRRHDIPLPAWLKISQHVSIGTSRTGVVKFIGNTTFKSGTWVGVKLDTPTGKNNGQVDGVHYFRCPPKHGIFVRPDKLKQINKPTPSKTKMIPARPSPQSSKVSSPNASPIRHHMMSGSGGSSPHSSPVGSPCVTRNMKTIRK